MRLFHTIQPDIALVSQSISNTNVTGRYFDFSGFNEALFLLQGGAMAAGTTTKLELFQATDASGTGSELITGKAATITANTKVTKATAALSSVLNGQTITINGLVFTAHTNTTTPSSRQFAIDGNDTADAAALATCINDATYGVPGVTAVASSGTVTLTVTDPGSLTLTLSKSDTTITLATVEAQSWVALKAEEMKANDEFRYVAAKVTTTATQICSVAVLRTGARYGVTDSTGAQTE